jgi:Zn finger protein HypA/HybF involved in hydrogenase expression
VPYRDRSAARANDKRLKDEYVARNKAFNIERKQERGGCEQCGRPFDETVSFHFEWAHIDPATKVEDVSKMVGRSRAISKIAAEIAKCRLFCKGCHSKETHQSKHFMYRRDGNILNTIQHPDQQQLEL